MSPHEPIAENLREALRFFGEATGRGQVRELEHALAIYSGIEYGVFNIAVLDAPAGLDVCAEYFSGFARRWSAWVCEDALGKDGLRAFRQMAERYNMREISRAPGMIAGELAAPRRELPVIDCLPVTSQSQRETFAGLAAVCFDIPMGVARDIYYPERGWHGSYRGFIGSVVGRPIGIVALVRTGGTLGVYSLAIQPESRRLGYGEALLRAAVAQAMDDGGVERLVLQSSESGESLYRHMGFREVTKFAVYLTR